MRKTFKSYLIAWAILLALYNGIVFCGPLLTGSEKLLDAGFWVAWGFTLLAFVGQLLCSYRVFRMEKLEQLFLHLPLITVSYGALILMVMVGSICMLIPAVSVWLAAILCFVILALSALALLQAKEAATIVTDVETRVKEDSHFIRMITAEAQGLLDSVQDPAIREALRRVAEALRYSDPHSPQGLVAEEMAMRMQFDRLRQAVQQGEAALIASQVEEFLRLCADRNRKCKALK